MLIAVLAFPLLPFARLFAGAFAGGSSAFRLPLPATALPVAFFPRDRVVGFACSLWPLSENSAVSADMLDIPPIEVFAARFATGDVFCIIMLGCIGAILV